ncbi:MAG: hypothetical protein ACYDDR_04560 [Acidithiobacillus ferrivorans]
MNIEQQEQILSQITTRDESGKHFTEIYNAGDLAELEADGLITIDRPEHEATGIPYAQEYWSVEVTDAGIEIVEAFSL